MGQNRLCLGTGEAAGHPPWSEPAGCSAISGIDVRPDRNPHYVKLNRVSAFIDGNVAPYAMIVGFDGSLVLQAFREFLDKQHATAVFNRVLAEMLLGGSYTEAVAPTDITHGLLHPTGYVRMRMNASSASGNFHSAIRLRTPNPSEAR